MPQISYGTVVGQFVSSSVDGADAGRDPDIIPLKGSIVFSAAPSYVLDYGSSPNPVTISTTQVQCHLDSEGYLCSTNSVGVVERGVNLVATNNPSIVPSMWTWTVIYNLKNHRNQPVKMPVQQISVPSGDVIDLTNVTKIAASNGTIITKGLKGDKGDKGDQGIQGIQGVQGIQGDKGDKGDKGDQGIQGIQGVQGLQGIQGDKGDTGDTGPANSLIVLETTTGPEQPGIAGPQGPPGDPSVYELRGAVPPNGIVTASPGTYYTDTAGTNGAWRWMKTAGIGNTGWVVIRGDTGWRQVGALVTPGLRFPASFTNAQVMVKRINETVTWRLSSINVATNGAGSSGEIIFDASALGSAWLPAKHQMFWWARDAGEQWQSHFLRSGVLKMANIVYMSHSQETEFSFLTDTAWPTTLPGI